MAQREVSEGRMTGTGYLVVEIPEELMGVLDRLRHPDQIIDETATDIVIGYLEMLRDEGK